MSMVRIMSFVSLFIFSLVLNAQQPSTTTKPAEEEKDKSKDTQAGPLSLEYGGDLWTRPALTGDWGGLRNQLADKGVKTDIQIVQYLQGNAHGGKSTAGGPAYSGTVDFSLDFDFQKMGLWPGGFARVRGETEFGHSANPKVGSVSAANFDALLPRPNDPGLTTLTEYWIMQFVSPKLGFIAGQVDFTKLPGQNEFASDRYTQFMNTSFWQNPVSFSTVPYSAMAVGAFFIPTSWFNSGTFVIDSHGTPTYSGFESGFHGPHGATVVQSFNFHIKPFGLPGNQRLVFSGTTREKYELEDLGQLFLTEGIIPGFSRLQLPRSLIPGGLPVVRPARILLRQLVAKVAAPKQQSGDWAFWYDFDQYLYKKPDTKDQGFGLFGRFGWSPGEFNPISTFYSLGVGGKGMIPKRDHDRFGIGYYILNISGDMPAILGLNAEQGVEVFYNYEVTPWLHITPDLQVIVDPGAGFQDRDVSIVYGLRAQMTF
jgi:porin